MASLFIGSLFLGGRALWVRELQTWVPIEAQVSRVWSETFVEPAIELPPSQSARNLPDRPSNRQRIETSIWWIGYSYVVDGRRYTDDTRSSHPVSGRVQVFYDPDHPGWSRLDRPRPHASVEILAVLLFLGGAVLWLGSRR